MIELEDVEICVRAAVRSEHNSPAIGRPLGLHLCVFVIGELTQRRCREVDDIQIVDAAVVAMQDNLLPIRTPGRRHHDVEFELVKDLGDFALPHIQQIEDVLAVLLRGEGELPAIGRECALRIQKPELFEVWIEHRLD